MTDKIDYTQTPPLAFSDISFATKFGTTPAFAHAGTKIEFSYFFSENERVGLWKVALEVLERLATSNPTLERWFQCARDIGDPGKKGCLLTSGFLSLQQALNVPIYPSKINEDGQKTKRKTVLFTACPYDDFVRSAIRVIAIWLNWSHIAQTQGELRVAREQVQEWCEGFEKLARLLPPGPIIKFHHQLWQNKITWQWLDGNQTRVGQGIQQKVFANMDESLETFDPEEWRVPIYTVTGSVGKTTTARLLWQLLQPGCQELALTASDGIWVGDEQHSDGDCIGGLSARNTLRHSKVQAAVFEQGRGGIIKQGVPYTISDVGILLNVQEVHLGLDDIDTVEKMADVKALGLQPAKLAILNYDDFQCRRIGAARAKSTCVWFSIEADAALLQSESGSAAGCVGLERDADNTPRRIQIWQAGNQVRQLDLENVAPYHGTLGEKTLEELLAVVAAAWFGPLQVEDLQSRLHGLNLDGDNHTFRTSVHKNGNITFVLDKAGEAASLKSLQEAVSNIAANEKCDTRILMVCRSAGETAERHLESAEGLYGFIDEFICFDRPDTYKLKTALPIYKPGSIPELMKKAFSELNMARGLNKPISIAGDWDAAENILAARLKRLQGRVLVLINQPSTASTELNNRILAFTQSDQFGLSRKT